VATEIEDNWTVFFFESPTRRVRTLEYRKKQLIRTEIENVAKPFHQLSNLVLFLAQNDIFSANDRFHMARYTVETLVLQEPSVPDSNQISFLDLISGGILLFQKIAIDK